MKGTALTHARTGLEGTTSHIANYMLVRTFRQDARIAPFHINERQCVALLRSQLKGLFKSVAFKTALHRSMYNQYPFMFSPAELMFLAGCLSSIDNSVPGCVVEAGCAYGATTVWLNKYMDDQAIVRSPYFALDTFAGFPRQHVAYEGSERGKSREITSAMRASFGDNRQEWFDKQMVLHEITRVRSLQCDVGTFAFESIAPIAYCLLDVDLYIPISQALPNIRKAMAPGGIIIVDDCWNNEKWDGALQAYSEFVAANAIPPRIVGRKLGVIQC